VIIIEATIRDALRLDDAEGIECLTNEAIFTELARIGVRRGMSLVPLWHLLSSAYPQWVKKLERRHKASKLRRIKKVGTAQRVETSDDTVMDDVSKQGSIIANMDADKDVVAVAKHVQDAEIEEHSEQVELQEVVEVVTTAKLITEVVTTASTTITAAALQLTTIPSAARRRNRVVIRDLEETATPSTIIHTEAKSKDKGKGIMIEEPKPLKKQAQIE
nr:hypothetical protein [Tanacetum cinerariifolium]